MGIPQNRWFREIPFKWMIWGTTISGNPHSIYIYKYMYKYIYIYPPTPAYAKAGAAPGNTGGVEC